MSENWQSEFLQFAAFIVAGIWLYQRGSIESKEEQDTGLDAGAAPSEKSRRAGAAVGEDGRAADAALLALALRGDVVLLRLLVVRAVGHPVEGLQQRADRSSRGGVGYLHFLGKPQFWEFTFQNWQSEFMALATMAIFTVFLRQRGSPESKPVSEPHDSTGVTNRGVPRT